MTGILLGLRDPSGFSLLLGSTAVSGGTGQAGGGTTTPPMTTPPVTTTPSGPMSQAFTLTNWGSAASLGLVKRGTWFGKGDVQAGSVPALSSGTAQFYGLTRWKDGSLKTARLLLRDAGLAAGSNRSYTMTAVTGSSAAAANGNAGLTAALAGHDFKVTFANVQTWDCSSASGNYAALGSGAFTASLGAHAAISTRWTLLTTGPVADVWQGWGMATDNAGGAADAHLKINWYVTRWKAADGTTLAFQVGAVVALDWWSVANKFFLTYDATLLDGAATIVSFPGVRHQYQSQWILCVNDGSLNAGTAPWIGAAQPTIHCSFDRDYAVAAGVVPPLDTAKRPTPAPQYAYQPCLSVADPNQNDHPNSHRYAIDGVGAYQGRGVITRFDADAFMAGTPQAYAVARLNALSGLGVPYHYRSNRNRTRPGESADTANTIMPLLMAPKAASYSDFTAQGLPIAVDAYNGSGNNAVATADGFTWQTGVKTYAAQGLPLRLAGDDTPGTHGPWTLSLDASHGVSYCYFMALVSGDEWLVEAQLDLAMNLAHQGIYGYHNNVQPFSAEVNSGRPAWNPSCPPARWSGLMAQYQCDAIRSIGWSQLIQGHAIALIPADHVAHDYLQAMMVHQGDYIQTNLTYNPPDFALAPFYSPDSQLGLFSLYSPWMNAFIPLGAYTHYALNEDPRWRQLGDYCATWSLKQAALGRWYAFDIYRTAHRRKNAGWDASANPEVPVEQQVVLDMTANLDGSSSTFSITQGSLFSENGTAPPPLSNGDIVLLTSETDGGFGGVLPAGGSEGQVCYIINLQNGDSFSGRNPPAKPLTFQLASAPGGSAMVFSTSAPNVNLGYFPQATSSVQVAASGVDYLSWPYLPDWGNYVPMHVAVIMMARLAGNAAATTAIRDGALAFTAPMDNGTGLYYSAFDMAI